jgi:hypothetical protein
MKEFKLNLVLWVCTNCYWMSSVLFSIGLQSMRVTLAGHVARIVGNQEDLYVNGRRVLLRILKKEDEVVWTGFIWLRTRNSGGML